MDIRRKYAARALTLACALYCLTGNTVEASDWETPEYYASGGLDLINAAAAYELGYTGHGVRISIMDSPINLKHPEFAGKQALPGALSPAQLAEVDWSVTTHGTHVTGIATAKRDGLGMHGVAFDADVQPLCFETPEYGDQLYPLLLEDPGMMISNNSWGLLRNVDSYDPTAWGGPDVGKLPGNYWRNYEKAFEDPSFIPENNDFWMAEAAQSNKLMIISAGNFGNPDPMVTSLNGWLFPEGRNNNIIVTNISEQKMHREGDRIIGGAHMMDVTSQHAKYVEDSALAAPGDQIYSADAGYLQSGRLYLTTGGTSMSAPFVSGTAALVQQAFPYMDAKQLGDVLLSTANNNISLTGDVHISLVQTYEGAEKLAFYSRTMDERSLDKQSLVSVLKAYPDDGYITSDRLLEIMEKGGYRVYYKVPMEEFVGQGVVDAGRAVRGPGALNARRLSEEDIYTMSGSEQLLYPINTKGYNSVWSNDIGEIRAGLLQADHTENDLKDRYAYYMENWGIEYRPAEDTKNRGTDYGPDRMETGYKTTMDYVELYNDIMRPLAGLHVGLLKKGEGTLKLTGQNSYLGDSVAAGGTLEINGSVAGNARSLESGTLAGSGTINGTLYNSAYAVAGDSYGEGTLKANAMVSTGTLYVQTTENGASSFKVTGIADVEDSKFMARPAAVNGVLMPRSKYGVVLEAGSLTGTLSPESTSLHPVSAMLSGIAVQSGNTISYSVDMSERLNMAATETEAKIFGAMKRMYDAQRAPQQRQLAEIFSLQESSARAAFKRIAGDDAMAGAGMPQTMNLAAAVIGPRLSKAFTMQTVAVPMTANHWMETTSGGNGLMIPISFAPNEGGWMKFSKRWGHYGATDAGFHGSTMIFGYDKRMGEYGRAGIFAFYGANYTGGSAASLNNYDWRLGLYGGWQKGAQDAYVYFDYGWERNNMNRGLGVLPLVAHSRFNGRIMEFGGEYRYDLQSGTERTWHFSPYVGLCASRYLQDGYYEHGAEPFNRKVASWSNNYITGELGVEIRRALTQNGFFAARLGWRHVFTGSHPGYRYVLLKDPLQESIEGTTRYDRNFLTCRLYAEQPLDGKWAICGDLGVEKGSHDREITASVAFRCVW